MNRVFELIGGSFTEPILQARLLRGVVAALQHHHPRKTQNQIIRQVLMDYLVSNKFATSYGALWMGSW